MPVKLPENKVIITVALTGALVNKKMNPAVPEQPDEIAQSAYECYNEGAAICHIHARDKNGENTSSVEIFRDIHRKIRERCSVILQDSTGGGPNLSQEQRIECLQAGPEMASLNMGTLMRVTGKYKGVAFSNLPEEIEHYLNRMDEFGVKPELEVYNHAMIHEVKRIIDKGLLKKTPYCVNIVLGMRYQGAEPATPETLTSMYKFLPEEALINCCAVGAGQLPLTTMNMIMGGCVRVGLEDNIYYGRKQLAKSNAQLVARTVRIARELGKEPLSAEDARKILGLANLP